ncbi:MAG: hypothetical protein HYV07_04340 [Deltaproteobacteria bacterium]|nr:hypothetical protein [Deltaproteobacteria bacterium]
MIPDATHLGRARRAAWAVIITAVIGCTITRSPSSPNFESKDLESATATFVVRRPDGATEELTMEVERVEDSQVTGRVVGPPAAAAVAGSASRTINLHDVKSVQVANVAGTVILVVGVALIAVPAVTGLGLIAMGGCPVLYVDDGKGFELAGVPFAGAVFRSIERDDLLPLGRFPSRKARLKLVNEGYDETDFSDRLELLVLDHSPDVRVISSHDAKPLVLGPQLAPDSATDLRGVDRLDAVRALDSEAYESDVASESLAREPQTREGLELVFRKPAEERLVLELAVGNTAWMDMVHVNYLGAFGSQLESHFRRYDEPAAADELLSCRDEEGIDLRVEVLRNGRFEKVAMVPTPGTMRTVAVPLPAIDDELVQVRVSGGLGFFRFDQVALSGERASASVQLHRIAPSLARDNDDNDVRELIAEEDGDVQKLTKKKDALTMSFDLPPESPGTERTTFFSSHGYYNIHSVPNAKLAPIALLKMSMEPQSMASFGLDLYEDYVAQAARASEAVAVAGE